MLKSEYHAYLDNLERQCALFEPLILRFAKSVVEAGLMQRIHKSRTKGMNGVYNGVVLRSFSMCGRVMFTFESEGGSVTLLGIEQSSIDSDREYAHTIAPYNLTENFHRVGLHTLESGTTEDAALYMIQAVCDEAERNPSVITRHVSDTNIRLLTNAGVVLP